MAKRENEFKIIQATYNEWLKTNPKWDNDQSPSVDDELLLIEMTQTALKKNKPE